MKRRFVAAVVFAVLAGANGIFGQGEIYFNNRITGIVDARIIDAGAEGGAGAGFTAQLFGGPLGSSEAALIPLFPTTTFRTTSAAAQGYVNPVIVQVPGIPPGETASVQMRVFLGADFNSALTSGKSNIIPVSLGGGTLPPGNLVGLRGFTGLDIPEPSTFSLFGAAVVSLCLSTRRAKPLR
jgi:hypothetical protein